MDKPAVNVQQEIHAYEAADGKWHVRYPNDRDSRFANRGEAEKAIKAWFAERASKAHINVGRITWHFRESCPKHADDCHPGCDWYDNH